MKVVKVLSVGVGILLIAGLALIGVLSMTRGTPISGVRAVGRTGAPPRIGDSLFLRTMELYTGLHVENGNHVDVMLNGNGSYPQLWKDIAGAQKSITMQLYYSQPGTTADSMAMFLSERARAGVRVQLLLDAFGSQNLTDEWRQGLRDAGVILAELRPLHWYTLHHASNRSHVRAIIIDGTIGWTGGFGLADSWQGNGLQKDQWRETNVRFTGPAVAQLQAAFITAWAEATGELLAGDFYFPLSALASTGSLRAGFLLTSPTIGSTAAERFLALSLAGARRTLYIANAYFVPDDDFRDLLTDARKRGVDVRVLTTGPATDIKSTRYAGRARYEELLRAGVRIWEYQPTMIHAKTIVADGLWTSIGSLNFDNRSLAFNNESSLLVLDSAFGAMNDSLFLRDLNHSKEIILSEFVKRSPFERFMETGSNLLSRIL
jgi:cardiolipin synthase